MCFKGSKWLKFPLRKLIAFKMASITSGKCNFLYEAKVSGSSE